MPKKISKKHRLHRKVSSKNSLFFTIVVLASAIVIGISIWILSTYTASFRPESSWCSKTHAAKMLPPAKLKTSIDFFEKGNYQYDTGDCTGAIENYTKAIKLNSKYAEAFNNRAYTYMMMNDYKNAIPDLDEAIRIRPAYVNALMNRGDIYNYYYNLDKDKAIADYDRVIALGADALKGQSTCRHRLVAANNHNLILVFWHLITKTNAPGCY